MKKNKNKKKILSINIYFQRVLRQVSWILQVYEPVVAGSMKEFQPLLSKIRRSFKDRGIIETINYIKNLRLCLLRYLSGNPVKVKGIKLTTFGYPSILGPLLTHKEGESPPVKKLRVILTILYASRGLSLGRDYDTSSITCSGETILTTDMENYIVSFWGELGIRPSKRLVPLPIRFYRYHFTTKSGPNGHALWNSLTDLFSLPSSLVESIKYVGGRKLARKMDCLLSSKHLLEPLFPIKEGHFRKIVAFPDKEMKVRVIAIMDYWSQTCLKPLHHFLNHALKKIKQDQTFDQGAFKSFLANENSFYSIDLSNATDRFPISLIKLVLKGVLPEDFVNHWANIMVGYPFDFKQGNSVEKLSYSVGNPMGAYSSWSSFAVAHHFVIYYCCQKRGLQWADTKYCLLGDDIVICDKDLAEDYLVVIKSLGVEISELKTHKSSHFYEFAKRLIYKNQEITPFPISALKECESRSYFLTNLLLESENKGWITSKGIPSTVSEYYRIVKYMPSRFLKTMYSTSLVSELMLKCMKGMTTGYDLISKVIVHYHLPIRELTSEESDKVLSELALEAFTQSDPSMSTKKSSVGLGDLAVQLVCTFTGYEDPKDLDLGLQLIYALPILGAYALIEEKFIDLKREAQRISTSGENWPILLKSMALPWDDTIFSQRQSHTYAQASIMVGKKLINKLLASYRLPP